VVRAALRSGLELDLAGELLELLEGATDDVNRRAGLALKRASLLAWGKGDPAKARTVLEALAEAWQSRPGKEPILKQVWLSIGDTYLLSDAGYDEARNAYRRAERYGDRTLSRAARVAQVGSYQFAVEDYLSREAYEDAINLINKWEATLPLAKLEGLTLFLRGKAMFLMSPSPVALRYLQVSEAVNPRALHAGDAIWLAANCLMAQERYEEAVLEFMRLRKGFASSKYRQRATEKINICADILRKQGKTVADGDKNGPVQ
jgi:tetratricopeptide (TPR) repeat protein